MSIAVPHTRRESLGETVAQARAQAVDNRRPARRVRHEVRDGLAVVAFSASASTALAGVITVLVTWAR
jgi:hypothetical protein